MEDAKAFLAKALNVAPEDITEETHVGDLDAWDSLGHMRLLMSLEERLGKELPATWVVAIKNVNDVRAILETGNLPSERVPSW